MKKPPTRKGKAFEIPRPENSRPLIVAAILTIIALACGALALAGRTRPAEERQTPAYVPPTRPPISIDAPEGWRVFSYPKILLELQVIGPYGGLHDIEGIRIRFIESDIFRPGCPSTFDTQGNGGCDAVYYRNRRLSLYSTEDRVSDSASAGERTIGEYRPRAFLMSERNHLTRSTPVNSGMCRRTKAYGTLQSVPPPMSPSPQNS